jgi:UDP-N-acetylmuramoyl-L-alanyl-D-glutamate--2,6-diaminopimelate ligase
MMPNDQYNIKKVLSYFGINLNESFIKKENETLAIEFNEITQDLTNDTRSINQGDIFCAIIGTLQDGRKYNQRAANKGASLIISECELEEEHGKLSYLNNHQTQRSERIETLVVSFYQLNNALFNLSKLYYGNPQSKMSMIGVTGTNGKTSTSQLLGQLLTKFSMPCPIVGTNGFGFVETLTPLNNTTPSAPDLHKIFSGFVQQGAECVAMEASSHALAQGRVYAELFNIALFTNLSRDHLDYHETMEEYAQAKKRIFTGDSSQIAVINGDDKQARMWLETWPAQQTVWVVGKNITSLKKQHYVMATDVIHHDHGVNFLLKTHIGNISIESPLLGEFNVDNLLLVIAVLLIQDIPLLNISEKVKELKPIAGRMESTSLSGYPTTVVDYAHTPDALEKALLACKQHCQGKLWVVFGCGGDRDKGKRPIMAKIAETIADNIVFTNDNPRTEDPKSIVDDMLIGLKNKDASNIRVTFDREEAVLTTISSAQSNDIILLAGKGHEDYLIVGNKTIEYNERSIVAKYYNALGKSSKKVVL